MRRSSTTPASETNKGDTMQIKLPREFIQKQNLLSAKLQWALSYMHEIADQVTDIWSEDQVIEINSIEKGYGDQVSLNITGTLNNNVDRTWVANIKADLMNGKTEISFKWSDSDLQSQTSYILNEYTPIRNLTTQVVEWLESEISKK